MVINNARRAARYPIQVSTDSALYTGAPRKRFDGGRPMAATFTTAISTRRRPLDVSRHRSHCPAASADRTPTR
ncbi:hypothetical protein [Streptomyces sp. NPDC002215]|uniref:hypothetical protein n=1 Tax=Streptomyces sp. NPDC002215 TaxID=3154412 RepID=UPI003321F05B